MNIFTFSGNLGRDAKTNHTASGQPVLNFTVAVKSGYGEHVKTNWVDCELWGKRGEAIAQYLSKGSQVVVSGELSTREYDKQDGTKGFGLRCRVAEITLVGGKREPQGQAPGAPQSGGGYAGDDVPF